VFSASGSVEFVWLAPEAKKPADRLVVHDLFPNGALSARLTAFPGTEVRLLNDWRVIVSNGSVASPVNHAIMRYFGKVWHGNVALVKYSRGARMKLNNVPCNEVEYAHLLLASYVSLILC